MFLFKSKKNFEDTLVLNKILCLLSYKVNKNKLHYNLINKEKMASKYFLLFLISIHVFCTASAATTTPILLTEIIPTLLSQPIMLIAPAPGPATTPLPIHHSVRKCKNRLIRRRVANN